MDLVGLLRRASDFYDRHLAAVRSDQWSMPSICDGWSVKDLADHVLGGNRFAVGMLAGLDTPTAFAAALADGFDADPVTACRASMQSQLAAFEAPGALEVVVHHPAGDIGARQFLGFRLGNLLLHGSDLARSTSGDDTLDEELVRPFGMRISRASVRQTIVERSVKDRPGPSPATRRCRFVSST